MPPDRLGSMTYSGGQITKRGVYSNMSIAAYHHPAICNGTSISSSGLRVLFNKSPAHYWCRSVLNPARVEEEPSRPMVLGRAMHHLALGQDNFSIHFKVAPATVRGADGREREWSLRTNDAKRWIRENRTEFTDIIFPGEVSKLMKMRDALRRHPYVRNGALNGSVERSAFIRDEETGLWIKIRPDVIPTMSGDFVDFKLTSSVLHQNLLRVIAEHGYAMQFALMRYVFRQLKIPYHSSTLIFVEYEEPYCVRPVTLRDDELEEAEKCVRIAIRKFARCWKEWQETESLNAWPGPGEDTADAETLGLPQWYRDHIDRRISLAEDEEYQR